MAGLPLSVWLQAAGVFIGVALGAVSLALIFEWMRERGRRRDTVKQLQSIAREGMPGVEQQSLLRPDNTPAWLQPLAASVPQLRDIGLILEQADVKWTLQTFLFLSVGLGIGLGLCAWIISLQWYIALLGVAVGSLLPYFRVRRRRTKRFAAFEEQLPDAIDLLGRAIRAGHPLSAGLRMVSEESGDPVAPEFRRVAEEQRFGMPFHDSLMGFADRMPTMDSRILVAAILVQREVGGNLAEILDNLSYVIRERFKIRRQLRIYTAQGRMTGYLLALMPVFLFTMLYVMNPEYMKPMLYEKMGQTMMGAGLGLQLFGFLWIRNIVNIDI